MATEVTISVSIGLDGKQATVRFSNRSTPLVVDVLGVEAGIDKSPRIIYLRCKLHIKDKEVTYLGWEPSGAISTILTRIPEEAFA